MWRTGFWFCLCAAVLASDDRDSKVVKTVQGHVKGYKDPEHGIYAFQSIPYATAPPGIHRYKAPLPPPMWLSTLEAVDKGIICPQATIPLAVMPPNKTMQEDCLVTSVYTPDTEEKNLPVMVYVHGGAFQIGFGDWMVAKKLVAEHNIILVTFNYRLGVHGFLCLGSDEVPGNAGMKDQVALLRWVNKNIAKFGGNPDDVTIAGGSAGSASVDLLMLSKSARGLFNKVIPESGANTAVFTVQSDPLQNAKNFANAINFAKVDDFYALEHFYTTSPLDKLNVDSFFDLANSTFVFTPCVERDSRDAFLTEPPVTILKNGKYKKVPLLYGFSNMEGLLRIGFFDSWKEKMNHKFSDFLPADLVFENDSRKEEVAKAVKEFYFGDKPISNDNVLGYVDYFTDTMFAYAVLRSTKFQVDDGHNQVYLYEYSFVDENTRVVPHTNVKGADHCAQSVAIIEPVIPGFFEPKDNKEFKQIASTLREMWANFIKTGKPVPEGSALPAWPAVRSDWSPHMSLGNILQLRESLLERRVRFWDDIYAKHYRYPLPPPTPPAKHTEL